MGKRKKRIKYAVKAEGEVLKMYEWHKKVKGFNINLTPKLALEFIKTQRPDQRKIREGYLAKLMVTLMRDEWLEKTGISIVFDENGHMIDGGHRTNAVVRTGITIPDQYITIGVNPEAYKVYDCGLPRHIADILYAHGYANSRTIQTSLNFLSHYLHGDNTWPASRKDFNHVSALKMFADHTELAECVNRCSITSSIVTPALSGLVYYLSGITTDSKATAERRRELFLEQIAHGVNLDLKSPARVYREWIRKSKNSRTVTIKKSQKIGGYIKAWNAFYEGREATTQTILWRARQGSMEPMPRVAGCMIQIQERDTSDEALLASLNKELEEAVE